MKEWEISDAVSELHRVKMMYGSSDAPFWFVGLEEANGDMEDDPEGLIYGALNMHLDYVRDGKRALRGQSCNVSACPDNCSYRNSDFLPCLYSDNKFDAKYQRTWGGYIKILLTLLEGGFTRESVKLYQKFHLADIDNTPVAQQSALLELFPLHCKRQKKVWLYDKLSKVEGLQHLSTAENYWSNVVDNEWDKLVNKIQQHSPSYVYLASQNDFSSLLESVTRCDPRSIQWGDGKSTTSRFATINNSTVFTGYHPAGGRGITDHYWKNIGLTAALYRGQCSIAA